MHQRERIWCGFCKRAEAMHQRERIWRGFCKRGRSHAAEEWMWRGFCKRGRNQGTKGLSGQQKRLWINFRKDTEKKQKIIGR